jgi:D-alanyl-D-alanine carboxypeptidase (penicillin-binding protein 5/6)
MNPDKTYVSISRVAANVKGTSADLIEGDILTVSQLSYGLMLPSGNDAAFALAEYFGEVLK